MSTTLPLTFVDLSRGLARRSIWIVPFAALIATGTYFWADSQPRMFEAQVQFAYAAPPDREEAGLSAISGVASLLGSPKGGEKPVALATMRSRRFLGEFVRRHDLAPTLFPKIWDARNRRWTVPVSEVPTLNEAASRLRQEHLSVKEEEDGGTIQLTLMLPDKTKVASLANELLADADARLRAEARAESRRNLEYLRAQLSTTTSSQLQSSIASLMETELRRQTLAQTGTHYAFRVIDPANQPRNPVWPRPTLFAVVSFALALMAGSVVSALVDLIRSGSRP